MVIVPSIFEPCGLTQMIALKYGSVPVVRAVGTVISDDEDLFSRMPNSAWSIHVGSGPSKARYSIADTVDVRKLLRLLSTAQTANT